MIQYKARGNTGFLFLYIKHISRRSSRGRLCYTNMQPGNVTMRLNDKPKIIFLRKILIIVTLTIGFFNAKTQTLELKNTKWKSASFWSYGRGIDAEIFTENTADPYNKFKFSIEFEALNFSCTNLTLEQSGIRQIKGRYHVFSNNYIKLEIDTVLCIKPDEVCSLQYKSDYVQIHKYWYNGDGKIEFQNTQRRDDWINKIVDDYLTKPQNSKVQKAIMDNNYIDWLPADGKKIKGNYYTILSIVCERNNNESDVDIERYAQKYKLLNTLYIQLPSKKVYETNNNGDLEELKP